MCITEQTLNHFLAGMTVDRIRAYSGTGIATGGTITGLQIWFPNGSFLSIYPDDNRLDVKLLGPSPVEQMVRFGRFR